MKNKLFDNLRAFVTGGKQPHRDAPTFIGQPTTVNDDEPDLSKAELFADSNRGVYIPQYFAQSVKRDLVTGVSDEDYTVLETGPDHENYWDAWADVLDNASIKDPKLGDCYLHQDGDLWVVPVEKEHELTILGIKFRKMEKDDYEGFAGADEGSYIGDMKSPYEAVLIYSPTSRSISEIPCYPDVVGFTQRDWNCTDIC